MREVGGGWGGGGSITVYRVSDKAPILHNHKLNETDIDYFYIFSAEQVITHALNANRIQANSITANQMAANSITANELAANSVTANNLQANSILALHISSGAVTADKMNVNQLSAISANLGTITAGSITANCTINVGTDINIGSWVNLASGWRGGIRQGNASLTFDPAGGAADFSHTVHAPNMMSGGRRVLTTDDLPALSATAAQMMLAVINEDSNMQKEQDKLKEIIDETDLEGTAHDILKLYLEAN